MTSLRSLTLLALAMSLASCTSSPAAAPQPDAKDGKQAADKEGELRKKQREAEYARLQLEIARMEAKNGERELQDQLAAAERELAAASGELDNFSRVAREIETAERGLSLDRSKQNMLEAAQELSELEAMYAQEDFATMTEELVINRGRTRQAMAKRDFELAQRRAEQLRGFEHPKREREMTERVAKAEQALLEAKAKAEKSRVESKLALLKAEHSLDEAEREVVKAAEGAKAKAGGG